MPRDTIFAPATAAGRAAIAVVRVSGPAAETVIRLLGGDPPPSRRASLRRLRENGRLLDEAIVLWLPGPESFTGEDCAELHLHGGRAVVDGVLSALARVPGLRAAEPGEFTRRAFENGRLDLAQAEAVADLVDAETESQRRQALDQLGGALSARHEEWREALVAAASLLEAAVDFPDEDLPEAVADQASPVLGRLADELRAALADSDRGLRVREGYRVALIGAPNAGKSSLLNALAGRDAAIVTAVPGTTRDVIEVPMILAGFQVLLADMAGLRTTNDVVEAEGVRRAEMWARDADLRLWVVDSVMPDLTAPRSVRDGDWRVVNKSDLARLDAPCPDGLVSTSISALDGDAVDELRRGLAERVLGDLSGSAFPAATRRRHREHLAAAAEALDRAIGCLAAPELAAEDVRLAARSLERITGKIDPEQVLDRVFSSFCIGK